MRLAALSPAVVLLASCNLPFGPTTYKVSSDAMLPTLQPGDAVVAPSKPCRRQTPAVGDVVVYKPPPTPGLPAFARNDRMNLSRVVAGPGARVAFTAGKLVLNGRAVKTTRRPQPFIHPEGGKMAVVQEVLPGNHRYDTVAPSPFGNLSNVAEVTLPAGHWFVVGDNRDNSVDSRLFGPLPLDSICGVAVSVLNSRDSERRGKKP